MNEKRVVAAVSLIRDADGYWSWRAWAMDGGLSGSQENCPSLGWAVVELLTWHGEEAPAPGEFNAMRPTEEEAPKDRYGKSRRGGEDRDQRRDKRRRHREEGHRER
jgi:hypothetical protein